MKFIYLLKADSGHYKIGISTNPEKRIKQLLTGNSDNITLILKYQTEIPFKLETSLKNYFSYRKIRGEWFDLTLEEEILFLELCKKFEKNLLLLSEGDLH